jgi:hypothetical protein
LRLGDHRLLHGRSAPRGIDEPYGFVARERAGSNRILNFRQHDARGDPSRVGEGLSAKHRRNCTGRAGHDREQVAHPIEDHDRNAMRSTKPQALHAHESAPAGHDDGGRHPRAGVVAEAAVAVVDKERAALDGQAGVVGLRRDHAGLDRKTRAPEGVGLGVRGGVNGVWSRQDGLPGPRRWAEPLMSLQDGLKRGSRVWPGSRRGVGLVCPERRRFASTDRRDDRRRVERITSWTPQLPACLFFRCSILYWRCDRSSIYRWVSQIIFYADLLMPSLTTLQTSPGSPRR